MDSKVKQDIINKISKASLNSRPLNLEYKGQVLATILPFEDYQDLQAKHEEIFKNLEKGLNGILDLVRSHTRRQSLAEVEAQLEVLRHTIEQEMEE